MGKLKEITFQEFAKDVERLCDFLLDQLKMEEDDYALIFDLRETAKDMQMNKSNQSNQLVGLTQYVLGLSSEKKEK